MREYISNRIDSLAQDYELVHEGIDHIVDNVYRSTFLIQKGLHQGLFLEIGKNIAELVDYKYVKYGEVSEKELVVIAKQEDLPLDLHLFSVRIQELLNCYAEASELLGEFHKRLGNINNDLAVYAKQLKEIEGELDNA